MLDKVELKLKAGNGGKGAVTFRREKFVPFGGPFGGDGGRGGDIVVQADDGVDTLRAYQRRRTFKAENGQGGLSKGMHGANGASLILKVPPGTLVFLKTATGGQELLADLEAASQQAVVARGGNGGYGNIHFATATNQAPRIAQPGIAGQEKIIILELRLIADAGIIGYPNVGKSSLLAALSAANPKIADYPFTTLEPILGVVQANSGSFVLAEIPGLIEGAHRGKGLGHSFLRHAMRTKVLVHLLDGSSPAPLDDMIRVNNELSMFDAALAKRPQVVAINKVDLPEVKARVDELKATFAEADVTPLFISAAAKIGLKELVRETWQLLNAADLRTRVSLPAPTAVFRPLPVDAAAKVRKRGNSYIVVDPDLERLLDKWDPADPADWPDFYARLEQLGTDQLLKSAGAKSGDTVITGNKEWKWYSDAYRRDRRDV
jgi:GTP-binding protein